MEKPKYQTRAQEKASAMEQEMTALTRAIQTLVESVAEIKPVVLELKDWKPLMESSVDELRGEVGELRDQIQHMVREPVPALMAAGKPPILPIP